MSGTVSFVDELAERRAQIPTGEAFAAQFEQSGSLSETALAGELKTGRMAAMDEPQEPVGWEDRLRPRRQAALLKAV